MVLVPFGCSTDTEEPNAFTTVPTTTNPTTTTTTTATETGTTSNDTNVPPDMPPGDGDGDPAGGDGDGDMTTTTTTTTTTGDGDGDDPTTTTTGNPAMCGNGVIDNGEQCDGGNLGGFTCVDLGYSGGTLACDPINCTYDASGCVNDMEMGSGGTTG